MELTYEATLEEICEPQVRYFLRSKTFARQRWMAVGWAALLMPFFLYGVLRMLPGEPPLGLILLSPLVGGLIVWLGHADTMKRRIFKHILGWLGTPSARVV